MHSAITAGARSSHAPRKGVERAQQTVVTAPHQASVGPRLNAPIASSCTHVRLPTSRPSRLVSSRLASRLASPPTPASPFRVCPLFGAAPAAYLARISRVQKPWTLLTRSRRCPCISRSACVPKLVPARRCLSSLVAVCPGLGLGQSPNSLTAHGSRRLTRLAATSAKQHSACTEQGRKGARSKEHCREQGASRRRPGGPN